MDAYRVADAQSRSLQDARVRRAPVKSPLLEQVLRGRRIGATAHV
jgi:hypothetical protein